MNHDLNRRRMLLALLAGSAGLSGALRLAIAQQPDAQGMRRVAGDVRVNGKPAERGTPVRPGNSVVTGANGLAVFTVGQDGFLMRAASSAEFSGGGAANLFRLATGKLLGVFGAGGTRQLETPTASVGIRGTGAYLESEPGRTYFCLCYGSADVRDVRSMMNETYNTSHHESPRYIYGDGRKNSVVPAGVINHSDSELIMLEALLGRTPPKAFMDSTSRY